MRRVKFRAHKTCIPLLLGLFLCRGLSALTPELTGLRASAALAGEYDRAFFNCLTGATQGEAEFNRALSLGAGVEFGGLGLSQTYMTYQVNTFVSAGYAFPFKFPVSLGVSYQFNGLPGYRENTHTLLPLVTLGNPWFGASVGIACRWTSFFGEQPILETLGAYRIYVNPLRTARFQGGIVFSNFDEFRAKNFSAWSIALNTEVKLVKGFSLKNDLEFYQSGSRNLTANFYGILYRGGAAWTL
ncbi:MAG: hypothetical protein LBR23_02880 [Spirochaetaceae bacterium]|jgi:hypothetical protein|nr:hypothetical protein [Spirochaetaceae bacterium]